MSVEIRYRNKQFTHEVSQKLIVNELIRKIEEMLKISDFSLKLDNILLLEDKPVGKYLITCFNLSDKNNRNIKIEMNDLTFDLKINFSNSKDISYSASATTSVKELKTNVLSKLRLTEDNWELKRDEEVIDDDKLLSDCIVTKVFTISFPIFSVFVKSVDRNHTINITKDTTVQEFRKLCFDKVGDTINELGITYNGQFLEFTHPITFVDIFFQMIGVNIFEVLEKERQNKENLTLHSYGVEPGSTLTLVAGLKGAYNYSQ